MKSVQQKLLKSALILVGALIIGSTTHAGPLKVCATTPDLGALVKAVGGEDVSVVVFTKGLQDPHFLEAKPSFVKDLFRADLYIQVGLDLESGWAPVILKKARNPSVNHGGKGFLDASKAITQLIIPDRNQDRSKGHIHHKGNPHYLLDPVQGFLVAQKIKAQLSKLKPESEARFEKRLNEFTLKLGTKCFGEEVVKIYKLGGVKSLLVLASKQNGTQAVLKFFKDQDHLKILKGWFKLAQELQGTKWIADHDLWAYFSRRFQFEVIGYLEPVPGQSPSAKHLAKIVRLVKNNQVPGIFSVHYFNKSHAKFVERNTDSKILPMAHQVGSQEGVDAYLKMIEHNLAQLKRVNR